MRMNGALMNVVAALVIGASIAGHAEEFERFHGVYGSADQPGRDFHVTAPAAPAGSDLPPPPGDLAIAAGWGDVAPWRLGSIGGLRFEEIAPSPYQPEPVRVEFQVDADGHVTGMRFETLFDGRGELTRTGDLPEGS